MKIVILDGFTLNPGDLSWEEFERLGRVMVYDRTPAHLIVERAKGAEILLTNKTHLSASEFSELPELRYIGVLATGYNVVDVVAAAQRDIVVTNIPSYGTSSVAQMTFALLLELCHHAGDHSQSVKEGNWSVCSDFCYWRHSLVELAGRTMGIIGYGRIGQKVGEIARAFGMKVIFHDRLIPGQMVEQQLNVARPGLYPSDAQPVELGRLIKVSDVISLHCPLFPETRGLVNANFLQKMKESAFLINTSRGPLVQEADLAEALNNGRIAGAGLDVLEREPPDADNPLFTARNCVITPHIAWATQQARARLMEMAVENLKAFLSGVPVNKVT